MDEQDLRQLIVWLMDLTPEDREDGTPSSVLMECHTLQAVDRDPMADKALKIYYGKK